MPSPYLWSFSHHYQHGKFIADGQYSDTAVDAQCGAAPLTSCSNRRRIRPLQPQTALPARVDVALALMPDLTRVFIVLAKPALAFLGAVLVWLLLVVGFGVGPVGAALVGLAAILAFTAAIVPAVGCVVLSHSRPPVLLLTPMVALMGAFGGVLAFHYLLQLFTAGIPSALPEVASRAQAGGSVVVWAVLVASMSLMAFSSHAPKPLRIGTALAGVGFAVGLAMWVRALGV